MSILPSKQLDPVVEVRIEISLLNNSSREKPFESCEELQEAFENLSNSRVDLVVLHLRVSAQSACYDGVIDHCAFEVVFATVLEERHLLPTPVQHAHRKLHGSVVVKSLHLGSNEFQALPRFR